jgi:negative regulator of flagellin synthesis FlgM
VRADKVSAIKQSIENGTYTIDKTKLAKSIYSAISTNEIG